jgi:hypothetical protein
MWRSRERRTLDAAIVTLSSSLIASEDWRRRESNPPRMLARHPRLALVHSSPRVNRGPPGSRTRSATIPGWRAAITPTDHKRSRPDSNRRGPEVRAFCPCYLAHQASGPYLPRRGLARRIEPRDPFQPGGGIGGRHSARRSGLSFPPNAGSPAMTRVGVEPTDLIRV